MAKKNLNNIKKCKLFHLNVEINERDSHANRLAKRNSVWKNEMTNDGRMKEMTVPKMTKLEEGEKSYLAQGTENLPHLKAGNKTRVQTRKKDSKEEGGGEIERKEKIKQKQHCKKARHSHAGGKAEAGDICRSARDRSYHFMLLLHLCDLLGVLLVHLLQFSHHSFTALAQSLFIVDELKKHQTFFRCDV